MVAARIFTQICIQIFLPWILCGGSAPADFTVLQQQQQTCSNVNVAWEKGAVEQGEDSRLGGRAQWKELGQRALSKCPAKKILQFCSSLSEAREPGAVALKVCTWVDRAAVRRSLACADLSRKCRMSMPPPTCPCLVECQQIVPASMTLLHQQQQTCNNKIAAWEKGTGKQETRQLVWQSCNKLSLVHISEPTRLESKSRMAASG